MATIKSFTDIQQSRKLAEILSFESADMCYPFPYEDGDKPLLEQGGFGSTSCWSLSALLKVIGNIFKYNLDYNGISFILTVGDFEVSNITAVDACYEMILELHKLNLL